MEPLLSLHQGVYHFAQAYRYNRDENEKTLLIERRYQHYQNLALQLFANFHIVEANYYFRTLDGLRTLTGAALAAKEISTKFLKKELSAGEFWDIAQQYPEHAVIPCGIFALDTEDDGIAKNVQEHLRGDSSSSFGKMLFNVLWSFHIEKEEPNALKKLEEYIEVLVRPNDVLGRQNYVACITRLFQLGNYCENISDDITRIQKTIKVQWGKCTLSTWDGIWQLPPDKKLINFVNQLHGVVQGSMKFFGLSQDDVYPFNNDLWFRGWIKLDLNSKNRPSQVQCIILEKKIDRQAYEDSLLQKELDDINRKISKCKSNILLCHQFYRFYLPAIKEELALYYMQWEVSILQKALDLLESPDLQEEIKSLLTLSKKKVFISYSMRDRSKMLKLKSRLEALDMEVLVDVERIKPLEAIDERIEKMIKDSDFTISLLSPNSLTSAWVGSETLNTMMSGWALGQRNKFIPVVIDKAIHEAGVRDNIELIIDNERQILLKKRKKRGEKGGRTPDLDKRIDRALLLSNNLGLIFERISEKITLDFSSEDKIDENFFKLIEVLKSSQTDP